MPKQYFITPLKHFCLFIPKQRLKKLRPISTSSKMNHNYNNQHDAPVTAYPPPQSYPPRMEGYSQGPYVMPPPTTTGQQHAQESTQGFETKSRGDGFLKGCAAALCCCCALDACF